MEMALARVRDVEVALERGGRLADEALEGRVRAVEDGVRAMEDQLDAALDALRREFGQQLEAALSEVRCHGGSGLAGGAPRGGAGPEPFGASDRLAITAAGQGAACSELLFATTGGAGDRDFEQGVTAGAAETAVQEETWDPQVEEFALTESIWDAAIFIGCPQVGLPGSLFTAATLMVNAAMQIVFCVIVNDSLTRARVDEQTVEDLRDWRTTVAHNLKYVDDVTFRSLATKVCSFSDTPMAAGPIHSLDMISEYQPAEEERQYRPEPPLGYFWYSSGVGEVMCLLSLVLWWLTVLKELFSMVSQGEALFSLPTAERTEISSTAGRLTLVSASRGRKATVVGVLFVRSVVCLFLAVCGTLYLASTISLGDLLLNALALEVVLSLDELTFDVLAPRSIRLLISSLAPLAKPPSRAWRGLDARPVAATAVIAVGLALVYELKLRDQSRVLQDAREAICGGNRDFIASVDQGGMVVAFGGGSTGDHTDLYEYRAFRDLILNMSESSTDVFEGSSSKLAYAFSGSRFSLEGYAHQSATDLGEVFNQNCYDFDFAGSPWWPTIKDILVSQMTKELNYIGVFESVETRLVEAMLAPLESCADVVPMCGEESTVGVRARQYCPVTCGCHNPSAPLSLSDASQGCPQSCTESDWHVQLMGTLSCEDWTSGSPQTLWGVDLLAAYIEGLRSTGWPSENIGQLIQDIEGAILQYGCPGLVSNMSNPAWYWGNLCEETNLFRFRPLAFICPVSCGCAESRGVFCPTTC